MADERARGWSAASEDAFLVALRREGTVKAACAAVGKWPTNAYQHRRIAPEFAAAWDAVVASRRAARVKRALVREVSAGALGSVYRVRRDGWTVERQRMFLLALAQTGCVRDACIRACISDTSAYRMRARSEQFAKDWDRALAKAMPTLEYAAYARAVLGWDETVMRGGEVVSVKRRYSDSLLRLLLQRGDLKSTRVLDQRAMQADLVQRAQEAARAAGGMFSTPAKAEETNQALLKQLKVLRGQIERGEVSMTEDRPRALPAK